MKKIALLYICTGRYVEFWDDFYHSVEKNFLKDCYLEYFVFTDQLLLPFNSRINIIEQEQLGWPFDTLLRFHMFLEIREALEDFDYTLFMNSNLIIDQPISSEILPIKKKLFGVMHPGFINVGIEKFTYERRSESKAYIEKDEGQYYFMGGFNGGKTFAFLEMSDILAKQIEADLNNKIVAIWHDESHLNKYFWNHRNEVKVLGCEYLYPEGWNIPYERKISIRDKAKLGGHNFYRKSFF